MSNKIGAQIGVRATAFDHPKDRLQETIRKHSFCHQIDVLLPHKEPGSLDSGEIDGGFSRLPEGDAVFVRAPLSSFLQAEFLERFLQNDEEDFRALSCSTALESDQSVAFHRGHLFMRVHETTFTHLGLPGMKSKLSKGYYVIDVKLTSPSFKSKGHFYDKVMKSVMAQTGELSFICTSKSGSDSILSHLKLQEGSDRQMRFHKESNSFTSEVKATQLPMLDSLHSGHPTLNNLEVHFAMEEIGKLTAGILDDSPRRNFDAGILRHFIWKGFLLPEQVMTRLELAKEHIRDGRGGWAAIVVRGFTNTPISWDGSEHNVSHAGGGENDYIVLLLPEGRYVFFVCSGASDIFKSF